MKRICPNCNKSLSDSEHYFCLSCGHKLGDELINSKNVFGVKIHHFMVDAKSKKKKLRSIFIKSKPKKARKKKKEKVKVNMPGLKRQLKIGFAAVTLIGVLAVGVIYLTKNPPSFNNEEKAVQTNQQTQPVKVENPNIADLDLNQPNINLANDNIIKYIPYETDFYIIGSDVLGSTQLYFGGTAQDLVLSQVVDYVEGRFVFMGNKDGASDWILTSIIYLKDKEVEDITFDDVKVEGWFIKKVDDVLVITNKEDMIQNVTDSSKGLAKNIAQNPKTRINNIKVPDTGQLSIVTINDEINPIESLMYVFPPTQTAREMLEDIAKKNPTKFVIRNEDD